MLAKTKLSFSFSTFALAGVRGESEDLGGAVRVTTTWDLEGVERVCLPLVVEAKYDDAVVSSPFGDSFLLSNSSARNLM